VILPGVSVRDSLIVGFGMIPRGEVAMIVALIGLEEGVIDQSVYVTLVLMALVTWVNDKYNQIRQYPL
jgi:Kef-type K+ transport system membrane component KefB